MSGSSASSSSAGTRRKAIGSVERGGKGIPPSLVSENNLNVAW